tara:strand:+ start:553 stop:837 length:285 start_codon:yes stop_codon:yes gene_type:complete
MEQINESRQKFYIGDYIRWPVGVAVFAASEDGEVEPIEIQYAYGIIVDIAHGVPPHTDVIIIYAGPGKQQNWIVCHVNDEEYDFEIISRSSTNG